MSFVWIAPGTFTMGSPSSEPRRYDSEGPQHRVTISRGFYLGKYEVTQEQWESVIGTRPWLGEEYVEVAPNNPAVYVSWGDTQILIHRLNEAAGDSLYQLPSEAEWEYACRAGTTTSWSFGNDWLQLWDYAWYIENTYDRGQNHAVQVGTRLPNPWGLFDMHGNVSEWCQDWYEDYSANNQTDPSGPSKGSYRVYRGGGYFSVYPSTRSAYRGFSVPDNRSYTIGVRLVRTK
ncbi:MAG: formylglycine-generating enzyme family protein [Candidatus Latescibacteria bacterium]|nr:formylglycine-generating enzyme family protein [Candidatus Latescibacterota bacterium]